MSEVRGCVLPFFFSKLIDIILVWSSLKYEKILHDKLLSNYNADVRPESEHDEPVNVEYDMVLQSLSSLVSKRVMSQPFLNWLNYDWSVVLR